MSDKKLKLIQIAVAHWKDSYNVIGLSSSGNVYRLQKAGWVALPMNQAEPSPSHEKEGDDQW